jgi:hypothetical protein
MADAVATTLAIDTLRRILIGATLTDVRFGVPQLEFESAEVPGEPYVQPFSAWTVHEERPASFAGPPGDAGGEDDLLKAVALRHKVVDDVEVLAPWPHLLLTFLDGSVLWIHGREDAHEAWIAGLNAPTPAARVQVIAAPGGALRFRFPGDGDTLLAAS